MGFDVAAAAYQRFMGRYSEPLADRFADFSGAIVGAHALDVGCGPGALTARLTDRLGASSVAAVDPSEAFVRAVSARCPGTEVHIGSAEQLPYADDQFDLALAQLAVHFFHDPVAGVREMARVTRPGGTVAATVWDHGGGRGPVSTFWGAVAEFDRSAGAPPADLPTSPSPTAVPDQRHCLGGTRTQLITDHDRLPHGWPGDPRHPGQSLAQWILWPRKLNV